MTFLWHFTVGNTTSNLYLSWIILTSWDLELCLKFDFDHSERSDVLRIRTNESIKGFGTQQMPDSISGFENFALLPPIILDYVAWLLLVRKLSISLFSTSPDDWLS